MKDIESKTEDAPKKIVKENYLIKIMEYLMGEIKPSERVSSKNMFYSQRDIGRNN